MRRIYRFPLLLISTVTLTLFAAHWRATLGHPPIGSVALFEEPLPSESPRIEALLAKAKELLGHSKLRESLEVCGEALELARGKSPRLQALALNCQGRVHQRHPEQTDYYQALALYDEALAISEQAGDRVGAAFTQYNIGTVFTALGESEFAMDRFEKSLQNRANNRDRSITLMEIATLFDLNQEHDLAIANLRDALKMAMGGFHLPRALNLQDKAAILDRLGTALSNQGSFDEAQRAFHSALWLYTELGYGKYAAVTTGNLGLVHLERCRAGQPAGTSPCDLDQALALLRSALDQLEENSSHYQAIFRFRLAQALRYQGHLEEARDTLLAALQDVESIRTQTPQSLLRTAFLARHAIIYDELVLTLMELHRQHPEAGHARQALAVAEKLRARDLLDHLQRIRPISSEAVAPNLIKDLNDLEHQRLLAIHQEAPLRDLANLEKRQQELLLRLESRPTARSTSPPLDFNFKLPTLDDNTLLLFFSLGEDASFLWRIDSSSTAVFDLPPGPELAKKAHLAYHQLSLSDQTEPPEEEEDAVLWLSQDLLGQLAPSLHHQRLLLVHDGPLESIPFAALQNPISRRELFLDHEIVRLPSLSISAYLESERARRIEQGTPSTRKQLVVFADPSYASNEPRAEHIDPSLRLPSTTRLKFSRSEAESILSYVQEATERRAYLGPQASRSAILEGALEGYRIVHLSLHAELNEMRPEFSQLVLASVDAGGKSLNGRLFVHELDDLKLDCDLIVLSACNTAIGKEIRGEGMLSMTRAVLAAGARRALVSLWYVDDEATAEFMDHFYRAMLEEGQDPPAALRSAQQRIQQTEEWSSPYFWAAFVLVGN